MNDPNDLQRFCLRVVHNPIIPVGLHKPEAQRQGGQILTDTSGERSVRQESTGGVNRFFDAIRGVQIVTRDLTPDFKEVVYGLGRELITAHA